MLALSLTLCIRCCDLIFTHSQGFNQLTRSTVIVQNSDDIEDANNVEPLTEEEIEMSHSDDGFVAAALRQGSVGNVIPTQNRVKELRINGLQGCIDEIIPHCINLRSYYRSNAAIQAVTPNAPMLQLDCL